MHAASHTPTLPADLRLGPAALAVADLARSEEFYVGVLGMAAQDRSASARTLGVAGVPLLTLLGVPGAQPQPKRSTGLFHVAILLPSRAELGSTLTRLARALPARRRVRPSGERGALPYRS